MSCELSSGVGATKKAMRSAKGGQWAKAVDAQDIRGMELQSPRAHSTNLQDLDANPKNEDEVLQGTVAHHNAVDARRDASGPGTMWHFF